MANNVKIADLCRDARVNAVETYAGTAPILRIYQSSGTPPTDPDAAINGTLLAEMTLPSDWMAASSGGVANKAAGTWQDASANNSGTADYFRIWKSDGTTCVLQGTVGTSGSDLNLDNNVIASGQVVTVSSFSLTDGNAGS